MNEGKTAEREGVMGWRDVLALQSLCGKAAQSLAEIGTFGHMSSADRIAMARELLKGTGCEVIDENGKDIIRAISYTAGYDAAPEERGTP